MLRTLGACGSVGFIASGAIRSAGLAIVLVVLGSLQAAAAGPYVTPENYLQVANLCFRAVYGSGALRGTEQNGQFWMDRIQTDYGLDPATQEWHVTLNNGQSYRLRWIAKHCPPPQSASYFPAPGTPVTATPPVTITPPAGGWHVGGTVGGNWTVVPSVNILDVFSLGTPDASKSSGTGGGGDSGVHTSIHFGWDTPGYYHHYWDPRDWSLGGEVQIGYSTNNATTSIPGVSSAPGDTINVKQGWDGGVIGRVGVPIAPQVIVYGTAGLAWQDVQATVTCSSMTPFSCGRLGPVAPISVTNDTTRVGFQLGAQFEYAVSANWKLRGEYRYADYGDWTALYGNPANLAVNTDIHLRTNTVSVGLTYAFGGPPAPASSPFYTKALPAK